MTHASVMLVRAVAGQHPGISSTPLISGGVCGAPFRHGDVAFPWWLGVHQGATRTPPGYPSPDDVNCPKCLMAIREADPVRWDALEERGLAPKLEAA